MIYMNKSLIPYSLTILILACNLSSHSHGYWPGDTWLWRSLYWVARLLMEGVLYYSIYQFIRQYIHAPVQLSQRILRYFIPSVIVSSIPFTMAAAMLDIATGRPDTYAIMVELENTGAVGTALFTEWLEVLPRHFAFCGLLFLMYELFQPAHLNPTQHKQYFYLNRKGNPPSKPTLAPLPQEEPTQSTQAVENTPVTIPFTQKLSRYQHLSPLRVQAQEHYISVTTEQGTELIQYRFGAAIKELEHIEGRQVHRSYWVADSNVEGWQLQEQGIRLTLHTGEAIPVSRRFEQIVKSHYSEVDTQKSLPDIK